ncbi:Integrin alpha beta-propellor repeat-containing protein [Carpediemonas membranifera]|uniref:Integrin alpha beta-propellor repeat-containing protein n=1 Tax=Carpediemonas membranifera TaxID=201153 RepID=A0A8J6AYJ7_9EUKA|nr:Integrin alpha beta-propellor repeat-containing protein [Carpediemonas membranifera]|eukprot:KAG9391578.1 Integrin alpha beta-propellor repeat-containing protein [Carpediemonas membranifera]
MVLMHPLQLTVVLLLIILVHCDPLYLRFQKLSDSMGRSGDLFGDSIATFNSTLVIGASGNFGLTRDNNAVAVFQAVQSSWRSPEILHPVPGTETSRFGRSVSLNQDWLAVGAPRFTGGGAVFIFQRLPYEFAQSQILQISRQKDEATDYGFHVALRNTTLAASALGFHPANSSADSVGFGAVTIHTLGGDGLTWIQRQLITANEHVRDDFGYRLALHPTVDQLIVTSISINEGRVYVYNKETEADIYHQTQVISPPGGLLFGISVDIHADLMFVGQTVVDTSSKACGAVYVYKATYTPEDTAIAPYWDFALTVTPPPPYTGHADHFGEAVSYCHDTSMLMVGLPGRDFGSGGFLLFTFNHTTLEVEGDAQYFSPTLGHKAGLGQTVLATPNALFASAVLEDNGAGSVYAMTADRCIPGTFLDTLYSCAPCPAGSFSSDTGAIVCQDCNTGAYQPEVGQASCKACTGLEGSLAYGRQTTCHDWITPQVVLYELPIAVTYSLVEKRIPDDHAFAIIFDGEPIDMALGMDVNKDILYIFPRARAEWNSFPSGHFVVHVNLINQQNNPHFLMEVPVTLKFGKTSVEYNDGMLKLYSPGLACPYEIYYPGIDSTGATINAQVAKHEGDFTGCWASVTATVKNMAALEPKFRFVKSTKNNGSIRGHVVGGTGTDMVCMKLSIPIIDSLGLSFALDGKVSAVYVNDGEACTGTSSKPTELAALIQGQPFFNTTLPVSGCWYCTAAIIAVTAYVAGRACCCGIIVLSASIVLGVVSHTRLVQRSPVETSLPVPTLQLPESYQKSESESSHLLPLGSPSSHSKTATSRSKSKSKSKSKRTKPIPVPKPTDSASLWTALVPPCVNDPSHSKNQTSSTRTSKTAQSWFETVTWIDDGDRTMLLPANER